MEKSYDLFADYYSVLTEDVDYEMWYDYLLGLSSMNKDNAKDKKVLDLGCGSGELLCKFYEDGFNCFGVDNSCEMLSRCDERLFKMKKLGRNCKLIQKDMQKFKLNTKFDFIYSACDSINYLSVDEVDKLFCNVCDMMKEGSVFTFDVINHEKFASREKISEGETCLDIIRRKEDDKLFTDIEIYANGNSEKINFVQFVLTKENIFDVFSKYCFSEIKFFDFLCNEKTAEISEKFQVVIKK